MKEIGLKYPSQGLSISSRLRAILRRNNGLKLEEHCRKIRKM
jgi:hypothetical protein